MEESTIAAIATSAIGLIVAAVGTVGGYFVGRRQEVDKTRLARAFPLAEEISTTVQSLYHMENTLAEWFTANFKHIPHLHEAVRYIEETPTYRSGAADARQVTERRNELRTQVRAARIYLNSGDLDRLEEYCSIGDFIYQSDGVGGMFFNNWLNSFFANLMDPAKRQRRAELFVAVRQRLNRMHEI